jgi:Holliday junction resolvase RusA-like endonuclease
LSDLIEVRFTIPGIPKGKARPRFRIVTPKGRKGFVSTYTPAETRNEEGVVRQFAQIAMAGRPPLEGPLEFHMAAYLPVPSSWSGKKRERALADQIYPVSAPDADNIAKLVLDAIPEIVFRNDSQVVTAVLHKRFSATPRVVVIVKQKLPKPV